MYKKNPSLIGFEALARELASNMSEAGLTVYMVDGTESVSIVETSKRIVLMATASVDPKIGNEPWCVIVEGNDVTKTMTVNCIPTKQLLGAGAVAKLGSEIESGRLSTDCSTEKYFAGFSQWGIDVSADLEAVPMTLYFCSTNHGIAFHVSVNARDNTGTAFSWAVIQRGVQESTMEVPTGASPLFAVFRTGGTGDPDTHQPEEVQRITIREQDIPAAALPVTACGFAPDVIPIMNIMQQVSVLQNNNAVITFPQMINTQRHLYRLMLDMLGYTSADIFSAASEVPVTFAGAATRTYLALNANGLNNRGVRVLFPMY